MVTKLVRGNGGLYRWGEAERIKGEIPVGDPFIVTNDEVPEKIVRYASSPHRIANAYFLGEYRQIERERFWAVQLYLIPKK